MAVSVVRSVEPLPPPQSQPQVLRHLVMRSGNEDCVGALIVAAFATEREAIEEGERLFARNPDFHFYHVVLSHEMQRTTIISSRTIA